MNTSQWATDIRTEQRQAYDPTPVRDWFADLDDADLDDPADYYIPSDDTF